ncbi:MAG: organic solvent tolerance protein OstA [Isosphaeraceae bacterium]
MKPPGITTAAASSGVSERTSRIDPAVSRSQQGAGPFETAEDPMGARAGDVPPPSADFLPDVAPSVPTLSPASEPPTELAPLPAPGSETVEAPAAVAPRSVPRPRSTVAAPLLPIVPGSQRVTRIYPRTGGNQFSLHQLPRVDGMDTIIIRGGVNIVTESPQFGVIDISADSAIIWKRVPPKGRGTVRGPNAEEIENARQPMEIYLEGDVIVRQDERKVAGNGDQKTYRAKAAYFDLVSERFIGLDAEFEMFAPGLIAPARVTSPRIEQYRPLEMAADGKWIPGLQQIRADRTMSTGSRFPTPGYRFNSKSIDITRILGEQTNPNTGRSVAGPYATNPPQELNWRIDARQNVFYMGAVPVFYWPRFLADAEDLEPPIRSATFRTNNYFGQQFLTDWNGFRLFNIRRPKNIDIWNIDVDYLSARTKSFPALGSEIGWFGSDLLNDLSDPYGKVKGKAPSITQDYFGYFDIWGLRDYGRDILGGGPAIITNNIAAGKRGIQRGVGGPLGSVPAFQDYRGRLALRHMQRFLPDDDAHEFEDLRAQFEVGYYSDRYFLEEYYKRLFDTGMDQETLFYLIRQKQNWAYSIWTEANLLNWETETQWLPRLDYYRLGDSLLGNRLSYFQHSGINYASTHTANEVNNPNIFAFLPYDPISNTSGTFRSGRAYTSQEVDLPLNFFTDILRVVPYVQGQAVGWSNQINGRPVGRVWGAAGVRAEVMAWKAYPWVQSELFNVHGLNHKINLEGDFRDAYSNVKLDQIGVQDDLDDNSYESTRRYFALTNYAGGLLPAQYDPRHLLLRRTISPITGSTDVQASIETVRIGLHQRLQTRRGPEGKRRIIDFMTFDLDTTYFPYSARDNFGKPFGQNTYNWQWFLGDRTSILSYGWFEFWNLSGNPIYKTNVRRHNNPFGLNVITSGVSLNRPPRTNIFVGYSIIDTGPINTSALTTTINYWMSPKYYGTYSTMYDFGNAILLAATFSLTRIGPDYLTSLGLTVDPQRQSYMFAFQISPRLSPNIKFGSGAGLNNFDSRYAPTQ